MENDEEKNWTISISLPETSALDLRGKQSVRATFKLTEGCIDTINIVAAHLGIKQKSLFDHLIEDARSLTSIAREIKHLKLRKHGRVQKTFVISRKSLSSLDQVSRNFNAPRDAIVEYSVQRLLPIIDKEREKHQKRKKMLGEVAKHFNDGKKLLNKIKGSLGIEDPVYQKFKSVMSVYENIYNNVESFIEKGKIIEDFRPGIQR
jgi:hypothetical protein